MPISRSCERRHYGGARAALMVTLSAMVALCCLAGWQMAQPANTPASPSAAPDDWGYPFPQVDWAYWQATNPDVVAWLSIPGTGVDGPVCAAPSGDPTYYLDHDVYRNPSDHGCLYLDASSGGGLLETPNAVICGHNAGDGLMLADAAHYANHEWADKHATIYVQTPEGAWAYEVAASEVISGWTAAKRTSFADQASFARWWDERTAGASVLRASQAPDVAPAYEWAALASEGEEAPSVEASEPTEHLVTLCTCSYYLRPANERTLTYAVARPADNLLVRG